MTSDDLRALVAHYRAGLEAEIVLLHRLESLAARERELTRGGDLGALVDVADERDRVMAGLVAIEHELKPIRAGLAAQRDALQDFPAFKEVAALHAEAGALINGIVTSDHHSLEALKEAELARRVAAQSIEQGESTLAAYRRVVSPPLSAAALVNRKG
jgi:hypothetical protein